jgi:BirA family biotin operon repressor/biotin-[acetyl-CoA-carboxylase] ligase
MQDRILRELKGHKADYISGEELSNKLQVSRTAIWKYINQLKAMGYVIDSQTKRGYRLVGSPDSLLPYEIKEGLNTELIGTDIHFMEQVDSTNLHAKRLAEQGFSDGMVIIADEQLKGKGRLGRAWSSPKGKGIWMSIMLKPNINPAQAAKLTLLTACAVNKAILHTCGIDAKIKWPNDIVCNGKKLCGILTEMIAELDEIHYLIVGIGINVNLDKDEFPEELHSIATSIKIEKGEEVSRKELVKSILNNFEVYYKRFLETGGISQFMPEYREKSAIIGKEVNIISSGTQLKGMVLDISEEGQLLVKLEDGRVKEIISGEVSIRALKGYI